MTRTLACILLIAATAVTPLAATGADKGDFEIGLFAGYGLPDDYGAAAAALNPDDDLLFGVRLGVFFTRHWSLEVSAQRFSTETQRTAPAVNVDFDIDSVRLNALYNFRPEKRFRPFLTLGAGLESTDAPGLLDKDDTGFNAGGGLRWLLGERFGLRLDGRWVSVDVGGSIADRQENVEAALGAFWAFGGTPPGDEDGDGVRDRKDRCPATPTGARIDEHGCPLDGDGDGVADGIDRCPETPAGVPVDIKGCARDSDGDGVHDGKDKCPDTPRGARVDAAGCPTDGDGDRVPDGLDKCPDTPRGARVDAAGCPTDGDRDGVADGLDKCPDTPRGASVDAKGCPKDSDGDGVYDGLDRCPGTPAGTKVDSKGCKLLFEDNRRSLVLDGVRFETNSARLTAEAKAILDRVALSLKEWADIRVEIAGHTDSTGADDYNLRLSTRRAEAVRLYLAGKGVAETRMTSKGYGEGRAIADNKTSEGRRKNRRVELARLD